MSNSTYFIFYYLYYEKYKNSVVSCCYVFRISWILYFFDELPTGSSFLLRPQENNFSQFMAKKFNLSEKDIRESIIEYRKNIMFDRLSTLEKEEKINAKQKEELLKLVTDLQNKKYELMQRDPLH